MKVDVALEIFENDPPDPETVLHNPVPCDGVLAARVTVVSPQVADPIWSAPADAVVGVLLKVMLTSSVVVQLPLVTDHLNTYADPDVPENVDKGLRGKRIVPPLPETILQLPTPSKGILAASITVVIPQVDASV